MEIADTYSGDVRSIADGSVQDRHGRTLNLREIIQRRWGWSKKTATLAADWLFDRACMAGSDPAVVWVSVPERRQQQHLIFLAVPQVLDVLLAGLANSSSKEMHDCDHDLVGINVSFTRGITDDGMVRNVIDAIAKRMDVKSSEIRSATTINASSPVVTLRVDVAAFDEGEPHVLARPDSGAT